MAVFYSLARCLFYRSGAFHCDTFNILFLRLLVRSEVKKIVHRMPEILFAAQIPFRCLDRCMPIAPNLSRPGNGSKDPSLPNTGCSCPLIEGYFDPFWNRHGADVATLTNEIHHCPVPLAHLDFIQLQAHKFRSAKTRTEQHGQHRVVALRSHAIPTSTLEYFRTLFCAQPVAGAKSQLLDSFHSANPGCQFRA